MISQVPNNTIIAFILSALVEMTHLSALQCGMVDAKGVIINPSMVDGTHKYMYKRGAI